LVGDGLTILSRGDMTLIMRGGIFSLDFVLSSWTGSGDTGTDRWRLEKVVRGCDGSIGQIESLVSRLGDLDGEGFSQLEIRLFEMSRVEKKLRFANA
jgi:hypothetical protein